MAPTSVVQSLCQLFLFILLGGILKKRALLSARTQEELSNLLLTHILPISIILSGNAEYDSNYASGMVRIIFITICCTLLSLGLLTILFSLTKMDRFMQRVSIAMVLFPNCGFIGLPLALCLFSSEGLFYAVVYNLVFSIFFYTLGVSLLSETKHTLTLRLMLDPLKLSCLISIILFFSPLRLPVQIVEPLEMVGNMAVPLSMIIIGGWMVPLQWKQLFLNRNSYLVVFFRLGLEPLLLFSSLLLLHIPLDTSTSVAILLSSLPVATLNIFFLKGADVYREYAKQTLIISMILSPLGMLCIVSLLQAI